MATKKPDTPESTFFRKLMVLIGIKGGTQGDVEATLKLGHGRITKWRTTGKPSAEQAIKLARHFGCSVEWLADDQVAGPPLPPGTSVVHGLDSESEHLLRNWRRSGLTADQASEAIEMWKRSHGGAKGLSDRVVIEDLSEQPRRNHDRSDDAR